METSLARLRYDHRQTGWPIIGMAFLPALCLGVILLIAPVSERSLPEPLLPILLVFTLVLVLGFSSLSVRLTAEYLVVRFGIGLFRKAVALDDVVGVEVVRTRWYEGWGVRWTPRGMLYSVAGFDAVRVGLANGRSFRVGSDDAPRLAAAITRALADRRARSHAGR